MAAILALVVALLAGAAAEAAFVCEAQVNRTVVPAGDDVVLTVTAEGDIGWSVDFALPDLPDVRVTSGGTNQSMSMVNGQTRTSVSRTWYLAPGKEGTLEIGPVKVTARGETCRTQPLRVSVAPASSGLPPADTGNRTAAPQAAVPGNPSGGGDIFVTLAVDKPEVWLGEQIILTFRYWRLNQPWNNPSFTPPRTEGFWREDLGPERALREVRNGRAYAVTEIRYALFATRAGDLVIEPAELAFPEDVFDRFFNSRRRSPGPRILRTERLTVRVKPLPAPAPQGFSGLVANRLQLASAVSPDSTAAGEPVELSASLEADGFLKGFGGLDIKAPEGARMHDATESFDVAVRDDRLVGRLSVDKVLVPDREGALVVQPVNLTWFDAGKGRYVTSSTTLAKVAVGPGRVPGGEGDGSGFLRSEISRLGDDLAFIHGPPRRLRMATGGWAGSPWWWSLMTAPVVVLGAWRLVLRRIAAGRRDPAGRRRRGALRTARAALDAVAGDPASVSRAVRGYVADCTNRPLAAVDAAAVAAYASACGEHDVGQRLAALLHECDAARYGGGSTDAQGLAAAAATFLSRLDSMKPAAGAARSVLPLVLFALAAGWGGTAIAQERGADPMRLLAEGNQAYTAGDLDGAITAYTAAVVAGADDATVHYNLGNAHARRGDLGLAVAGYLRAQRLDPRDGDIRANLTRVRGQIRDLELTSGELPLFIGQFVGAVGRLTLDEWATLLVVLAWGLAAIIGLAWFRGGFGDALRRAALVMAGATLCVGAVTAWRWHGERGVETAVVVAQESAVRSGPADTFPVLFMVHDGLTVKLDGEREGWVRVTLGGDWQGWLPRPAVVLLSDGPATPSGHQGR